MASFEPEQTPSRTGGSSRPDFRGRRVHSETQATRDRAAFTTSLPPRTTSNQQAVNHRIQHQEDELQEMKLRQQRVEEQLRLLQEENSTLRNEVSSVQFFFNYFVSLPHRIAIGRFPYIAINLYPPPPPPPQLPGQVNKVQQHISEPQGSKKQRLPSELSVSASCR